MKVTEEQYMLLSDKGKMQFLLTSFNGIYHLYDDKEIGDDLSKAYNLVQESYFKLQSRFEISD